MENENKKVVLGVAAHPDDLDFGAAGTIAKFSREGYDCYYLILTDGSKGTRDPKMTANKLAAIRKKEQLASAKIVGAKGVFFLSHKDGELVPDMNLRREIVQYIRKLKPEIVITHDPSYMFSDRYVNHTDHRAAGTATIDAVAPAARNPMTFPELRKRGFEPHSVSQLYLASMGNANFAVDITKFMDLKIKALSMHKSQGIGRHPEFMKEMSARLGKKWKYKHAETFFRIELAIR
ncbi:MAG: PIG-L deacetylase family protein [Candidatus Micrarchaeaceae archaeon]